MTQVEITNLALTRLGEGRVTAVPGTTEIGALVNVLWTPLLDAELRGHTWAFSVIRAEVTRDATAPAYGYAYRYALPTGFLRLLSMGDQEYPGGTYDVSTMETSAYRIEGGYIVTDDPGHLKTAPATYAVWLRYVQTLADQTKWDASFIDAFSLRLAANLARRTGAEASVTQELQMQYREAVRVAAAAGAMQAPPEQVADSSWINSRW